MCATQHLTTIALAGTLRRGLPAGFSRREREESSRKERAADPGAYPRGCGNGKKTATRRVHDAKGRGRLAHAEIIASCVVLGSLTLVS